METIIFTRVNLGVALFRYLPLLRILLPILRMRLKTVSFPKLTWGALEPFFEASAKVCLIPKTNFSSNSADRILALD